MLRTCESERGDLKLKLEQCSSDKINMTSQNKKLTGKYSDLKDIESSLSAEIRTLKGNNQDSKVNDLTNQLGDCHTRVTSLTNQLNEYKKISSTAESKLSSEIAKGK